MPHQHTGRTTLRHLRRWVSDGSTFPMLTCYDATSARWLYEGGLRVFLVGDTAAQFILGHDATIHAPLDFMLKITAAVRRGAPNAFVMGDMPFGSYQCGDDEAMKNASAFLTEGQADAVKLEVDVSHAPLVSRMASAGIPVVAHIGSRPQQVRSKGGYRSAGRTADAADRVVEDAAEMLSAGASMLLIEAVPDEVAERVVRLVEAETDEIEPVPVIGCGAGPSCHGHVIVLHDLLGLTDWHPPFAPPKSDVGKTILQTAQSWIDDVQQGRYLADGGPYRSLDEPVAD